MSRFNRPSSLSDPGLARLWNTLALLFFGLTGMVCLCMSAIFAFPQAPFNPFPPGGALPTAEIPATVSDINLPTGTALPTLGDLPPEQTATPATGRPVVSETTASTQTPSASGTQALATPTNTPQPPLESPTATATLGGYPGEGTPGNGTPYP